MLTGIAHGSIASKYAVNESAGKITSSPSGSLTRFLFQSHRLVYEFKKAKVNALAIGPTDSETVQLQKRNGALAIKESRQNRLLELHKIETEHTTELNRVNKELDETTKAKAHAIRLLQIQQKKLLAQLEEQAEDSEPNIGESKPNLNHPWARHKILTQIMAKKLKVFKVEAATADVSKLRERNKALTDRTKNIGSIETQLQRIYAKNKDAKERKRIVTLEIEKQNRIISGLEKQNRNLCARIKAKKDASQSGAAQNNDDLP